MCPHDGLRSLPGQTVVEILVGPVEAAEGIEMPGIAGSIWHYADLLVRLGDGRVLSLGPPRSDLLNGAPPGASSCRLLDATGQSGIGKCVIDLLAPADGEPSLYLLLEEGSYLEHSYGPGGSRHILGNLREWDAADFREEVVSRISGERQTWEAFMASPPEPPGS